jgi:outer membrane receptor for ferrienterochelin and colicins
MNNNGGETNHFTQEIPRFNWYYRQEVQRSEAWAKIGYMNPNKKWQSMGLQLSGLHHQQKTNYSNTIYNATQQSFYANYIYQSIIKNTNHVIKMGTSFVYDNIDETFVATDYKRREIIPGAFMEYSYNYLTKLNVVAGLRGDYHNVYGAFVTPRLHVRYAPNDFNAIRASVGRAQRTANIFAENFAHMASNRHFFIQGSSSTQYPYGLDPEIAWNMGLNFTHKFKLGLREGTFGTDYYFTHFQNQVVVDIENPTQVRFYNLDGASYAHSFQTQIDYEIIPRLDVRLAYRFYDIKTTYNSILLEKPLISKHRGFINLAYATRNHWKFDYTFQIFGSKRLPMHSQNGVDIIASSTTKPYTVMNLQISKTFKEDIFDVYMGIENLVGNMQHHMILMSEHTTSPYFDASLIWGQAMGRNIYIGFRYNIPRKSQNSH